ncbi:MAG: OpgC domain-containing protein, partial [Actinocrinis sp.]
TVPAPARPADSAVPGAPKKRTRLVTLDLMRGYYVGVLAAIHLNYLPSLFGWFDGRGVLLTSEAEGFFFISGLLVGMLRRRDLEKRGFARMTRNSWKRGLQLYVVAISLTLLFTYIGRYAVDHGSTKVKVGLDSWSSFPTVLENALMLKYTYGWADFLTFYVPMFLLAPLVVWMMSKRLTPLVLALAYCGFLLPSHFNTRFYGPFLQWEVYFFFGAVVGYHWDELRALMHRLAPSRRRMIKTAAAAGAIIAYAIGMVLLHHPTLMPKHGHYNSLFQNNRLGLLRPFVALVCIAGAYIIVHHFEGFISRTVGKVLLPFGRSSLYVYVAQSFFVFLVPFAFAAKNWWFNTAFDLSVIALILLAVRTRFLAFLIPKA